MLVIFETSLKIEIYVKPLIKCNNMFAVACLNKGEKYFG